MKVILNTEVLAPPLTGIGTYLLHLIQELVRHPAVGKLICIPGSLDREGRVKLSSRRLPWVIRGMLREAPLTYRLRAALRKIRFVVRCHQEMGSWRDGRGDDLVYHDPHFTLNPFRGPRVVTIHDLSGLRHPAWHPPHRSRWLEREIPRAVAEATCIIAVSEFTREEIVALFPGAQAKVQVVPLGVDSAFRPYERLALSLTLRRYKLSDRAYILSVATLEPRKNALRMFESFALLPDRLRALHPLVLVGAKGWLTGPTLRAIERMERAGELRWLGYLPREDLPHLYAGAFAFAYPSLYEGFGLPVLEAMASGVPLMTSDRAPLRELARGAAVFVDPQDVSSIRDGFERLLTDSSCREDQRQEALRRAGGYSWQRCAEETVKVYERALGRTMIP